MDLYCLSNTQLNKRQLKHTQNKNKKRNKKQKQKQLCKKKIPQHSSLTQLSGYQGAPLAQRHVVAHYNVINVRGDAGVCADAVPLHQADQIALRQET